MLNKEFDISRLGEPSTLEKPGNNNTYRYKLHETSNQFNILSSSELLNKQLVTD